MATYTYPGVYVEEIPPQVRPIAGVGTSTAAFLGVFDERDSSLTADIKTFAPDVIITPALRSELDDACATFIAPCTRRKVLRMSMVGRQVCIHRLRPERISIDDVSEQRLLEIIREVVSETQFRV